MSAIPPLRYEDTNEQLAYQRGWREGADCKDAEVALLHNRLHDALRAASAAQPTAAALPSQAATSAAYACRREADGSVCCAAWCGDIERCVRVDVAQWPTDEWYERAWEIASEVAKHNAAPRRLVFAYLVSQEMVNRLAVAKEK
jgi:hypothetical protein